MIVNSQQTTTINANFSVPSGTTGGTTPTTTNPNGAVYILRTSTAGGMVSGTSTGIGGPGSGTANPYQQPQAPGNYVFYASQISGYNLVQAGECQFPIGGTPCGVGGFGGVDCASTPGWCTVPGGVSAGLDIVVEFRYQPIAATGDAYLQAITSTGAQMAGVSLGVDSGSLVASNPRRVSNLAGNGTVHTYVATNVPGYAVTAGECQYPTGGTPCSPAGYGGTTCNSSTCSTVGGVFNAQTTVVIFKYTPSGPPPTGTFIRAWGSKGTANGQFNFPWGIAVDSSGSVFVADTYNNRIQKFAATGGAPQLVFGGGSAGAFNLPRGVAIAPNGDIYVADSGNNRVVHFNSSGGFIGTWGTAGTGTSQFNTPNGIAIDSTGAVFVTDTGNNRVMKFTATGSPVKHWGTIGSATRNFNAPRGIAITGTTVWITDYNNNRVVKYNTSGTYSAQFPTGTNTGPRGVAVDPSNGSLYVAEELSARVSVWTASSRTFIMAITGGFLQPMGVAASTNGIYVADTFNHRIEQFTR